MVILRALAAGALAVAAGAVCAQAPAAADAPTGAWPARTVQLVVPSPPGSGIDVVARMLAQRLSQQWGQPVVVHNRAGANSIIGTESVARAAPDGYTLLFASDATFTVLPHLYAQPAVRLRCAISCRSRRWSRSTSCWSPIRRSARANAGGTGGARAGTSPGGITYASYGAGSASHLLSELLRSQTRTDLLHVPYKGIGPAVAAVLAGEAHLTWAGVYSTEAHVKAGRLKALGDRGAGSLRVPARRADVRGAGLPGGRRTTLWFGLFAPAGTPRAVVDRVHRDVARILADPERGRAELARQGVRAGRHRRRTRSPSTSGASAPTAPPS